MSALFIRDKNGKFERVPAFSGGGENGSDSFSPIAKVEQTETGATVTITDKDGTTTATITNGKNGATPIKGTDYWTPEDKAEMQSYIDSLFVPLSQEEYDALVAAGTVDANKYYLIVGDGE